MGILVVFLVLGCMNFYNAYMQSQSEEKRKIALRRVTIDENGHVKASFRKYNSAEGYLRYMFYQNIIGGAFMIIYGVLTYYIKNIELAALITIIAFIAITDYILYRKYKRI